MKVKMISRNLDDYLRETKKDIQKVPRNYDPSLHPHEAPREYVRALNAVKLERVFAKPFLGSLDGHRDGVSCMAKHPQRLGLLFSGACDGEIRIWDVSKRKCVRTLLGHSGFVRGITVNPTGDYFFSCGDDKIIKQWSVDAASEQAEDEAMNTIIGKTIFNGIDHHWKDNVFATCGQQVDIWNEERVEPVRTYKDLNTITSLRFNPVETNFIAATVCDRSIDLYDIRHPHRIRKTIMTLNSNAVAWNPLEPFHFTAANEDYNLYTYDMRKMNMPLKVHKDHVAAVMDVDYSPTGREFVTGSYDKSVRIFRSHSGHSREVYHTKRMQRVLGVKWSSDSRFIFSASEEMNLRMWKANASEKLGVLRPREKEAFNYNAALKQKFSSHPQVRRIAHHRHVPRHIYTAAQEHRISTASKSRKLANKRAHNKPGVVPYVPEKKKHVVQEVE